jgi:LCP family protein required for cell wall assembly
MTFSNSKIGSAIRWGLVLVGIWFVFQILSGAYALISGSSLKDVLFGVFAGELAQDSEERTNLVILGTGGGKHDGADLTDSFIVASYSHRYGTLSLLSIPRDLWVEASDGVGMRVNQIYEYEKIQLGDDEAALENVAETASRISGVPIHYYLKINFQGFVDLVDALGGVKVLVDSAINDPNYPCPNLLDYCPFQISTGVHELDGETALKYARSRKTTSDFDRAHRQQQLLEALREKAFTRDILTNPGQLRDLYALLEENLTTNLRLRELVALGQLADGFNRQNLATVVLSDEPNFTGGMLFAPPREDYNGAAVLIPEGNDYRRIHTLTEVFFGHPRVVAGQLPIQVLNSTKKANLASDTAYWLNRYGFETFGGNYREETLAKTKVYYFDESELTTETLTALKGFVDADYELGSVELKKNGFSIVIVLGEDWRGGE